MDHYIDDDAKRRLIDRVDIIMAIDLLRQHGYDDDDLIREITRIFYIDLDEYNEIVSVAA